MDSRRIVESAGPPRGIATTVPYDDNRHMATLLHLPAAREEAWRRAGSPAGAH